MPDKILEINAGDTHTVNSTVTEQWTGDWIGINVAGQIDYQINRGG